jgi:hypothetical protein
MSTPSPINTTLLGDSDQEVNAKFDSQSSIFELFSVSLQKIRGLRIRLNTHRARLSGSSCEAASSNLILSALEP